MILRNRTTGKTICEDLKVCQSFKDRTFGLLLKSNPRNLLFKTRFGIHTFFLKESIDVLIIDKNMQVVKIKQNLKQNQLFFWNPKYSTIIELPSGTIAKQSIKPSQILEIS